MIEARTCDVLAKAGFMTALTFLARETDAPSYSRCRGEEISKPNAPPACVVLLPLNGKHMLNCSI